MGCFALARFSLSVIPLSKAASKMLLSMLLLVAVTLSVGARDTCAAADIHFLYAIEGNKIESSVNLAACCL